MSIEEYARLWHGKCDPATCDVAFVLNLTMPTEKDIVRALDNTDSEWRESYALMVADKKPKYYRVTRTFSEYVIADDKEEAILKANKQFRERTDENEYDLVEEISEEEYKEVTE